MPAPLLLHHQSSLEHDTGTHPERPARIVAIERALAERDWLGWDVRESPAAELSVVHAVHPAGYVQGGILAAMLDDTIGPAVFVMTEGKLYTATITMTVNFLAPAKPGPFIGEANVTQLGKTIAFVEGRLMAEDGCVLATATTSLRLVETAKAIR